MLFFFRFLLPQKVFSFCRVKIKIKNREPNMAQARKKSGKNLAKKIWKNKEETFFSRDIVTAPSLKKLLIFLCAHQDRGQKLRLKWVEKFGVCLCEKFGREGPPPRKNPEKVFLVVKLFSPSGTIIFFFWFLLFPNMKITTHAWGAEKKTSQFWV